MCAIQPRNENRIAGGCCGSAWCEPVSHFLGVRFLHNGALHYGWIRVRGGPGKHPLQDYAYETEPNAPINAGAGYPCTADPNCDGAVNVDDLLTVITT